MPTSRILVLMKCRQRGVEGGRVIRGTSGEILWDWRPGVRVCLWRVLIAMVMGLPLGALGEVATAYMMELLPSTMAMLTNFPRYPASPLKSLVGTGQTSATAFVSVVTGAGVSVSGHGGPSLRMGVCSVVVLKMDLKSKSLFRHLADISLKLALGPHSLDV